MEKKNSKKIKKLFLKDLNKKLQSLCIFPEKKETFFKEWNDEVSIAWIKDIEASQKQLEQMKRIKFTYKNEETDFNSHNHQKYTQIIKEESDSQEENRLHEQSGLDSDSSSDLDKQQQINQQPFFRQKPKTKIILRQQRINEFLNE